MDDSGPQTFDDLVAQMCKPRVFTEADLDDPYDPVMQHPVMDEIRAEVMQRVRASAQPHDEYLSFYPASRMYHLFVSATNEVDEEIPWVHNQGAAFINKVPGKPRLYTLDIADAAAEYVNQPLRSKTFDRILLDALIASELFSFIDDPATHDLRSGWRIWGFAINLVLAAFLVWVSSGATWAKSISAFLIIGPFIAPMLDKRRKRMAALVLAMADAYRTLNGPISSLSEVRHAVDAARDKGAVWPTPLWVLLDDIQARRVSV